MKKGDRETIGKEQVCVMEDTVCDGSKSVMIKGLCDNKYKDRGCDKKTSCVITSEGVGAKKKTRCMVPDAESVLTSTVCVRLQKTGCVRTETRRVVVEVGCV